MEITLAPAPVTSVDAPFGTAQMPRPDHTGVRILGPTVPRQEEILTPAAQKFLAGLSRAFEGERVRLLADRKVVQARLDAGERLDFLKETAEIRRCDFRVAKIPKDLLDRRVEITGPVDRKMIINALNSGANVFMADFEDSTSPTWQNIVEGQVNLLDAVRGTISYVAPAGESSAAPKSYRLNPKTATLMVRPRGLHLLERHVLADGKEIAASLFDFGLFFFHNAQALVSKGTGPYFYLPKLESHREARLFSRVFAHAESSLGLPLGTIRATVLIETLPAAFEMDEILWELRDYSAGLNCGRWDYIFSFIKKQRTRPDAVLPDRGSVTMDKGFLKAYSARLVKICHRRGAHAMGGMAAQIPIKNDEGRNREALAKVETDKRRESRAGHDGTWVAHPGLVELARRVFDEVLTGPNQIDRPDDTPDITAEELLAVPQGKLTEDGLRRNIRVGIQYLEAWLRGQGCVPIEDLMEDAATAEISRTQLWQWLRQGARLDDGRVVTLDLYRTAQKSELGKLRASLGEERFSEGRFLLAAALFDRLVTAPELAEFLTIPAYEHIVTIEEKGMDSHV